MIDAILTLSLTDHHNVLSANQAAQRDPVANGPPGYTIPRPKAEYWIRAGSGDSEALGALDVGRKTG